MTPVQIASLLNIISACPLFCGMKEAELKALLEHEGCNLCDCPAGGILPSDGMLILLSGRVLIEKPASDGRSILMREALPPEAINAASALSHCGSMSRLSAPDGCKALHISGDGLYDAISKGGIFSINMTKFLVSRVVFLNKKITSLAGYTASSRLTLYLEENAKTENGVCTVTLPCSLTEFAEYLGVGRASLYRTLDAMEADGAISRKGRVIRILKEL